MRSRILCFIWCCFIGLSANEVEIYFRDSSQSVQGTGVFHDNVGTPYVMTKDSIGRISRYIPEQTDSLFIGEQKYIPKDGAWLFIRLSGRITWLYPDSSLQGKSWLLKDDVWGTFSMGNLKEFTLDNPVSTDIIYKREVSNWIQYSMITVGLLAGGFSVYDAYDGDVEHMPAVYLAFFSIGLSWLPGYINKDYAGNAIKAYNQ